MRNANDKMNSINEIKMRNATASANGMKIESFCAGDLSALACHLFISFSSSLLVSDLFKSFLLAFTFSAFTFQLSFTLVLFVFFVFKPAILVFTVFLLSFSLSLLFFEKWFPP
jgi:hypothetical protein